jgi:hypothetical protein
MKSKNDLESKLNTCQNNFYLISLGLTLIVSEEADWIIRKSEVNFGRFNVKFDQILQQPRSKLVEAIYDLSRAALRTLITEGYEGILSYANDTGQFEKLTKTRWYQFARAIRNAFNHNFHLNFKEKDARLFPLQWSTKSTPPKVIQIDFSMNGWPVDVVNRHGHILRNYLQFTYEDALDLFDDFKLFVKSELD